MVVGRRVPRDRAAGRVRADVRAVPAARSRLGDRRRAGLWLVDRRAPRADVRLPLQPDRRTRQRLAVVELAAGAQADMVPRQQLRWPPGRAHLQRRQPDPLLGRHPGAGRLRLACLEAALAGVGADRRGLRLPARPVDPDRARHLRLPLPDGGDLRDDRGRLRRRRAAAKAGVARAGDRLPRAGRGRRHPHLPARLRLPDAGLVRQRGPRTAAVELQLPVPRSTAGRSRRAVQPQRREAAARLPPRGDRRGVRDRRPRRCWAACASRATRAANR